MFKAFILFYLILSSSVMASAEDHIIPLKERIRLSLWVEGIGENSSIKSFPEGHKVILPEELERALKKI